MPETLFAPRIAALPRLSHVRLLRRRMEAAQPQRKRDRTRARLLWATAQVIAEKGLDRLRAPDIAAAAGVSVGAFYVYFIDRDDAARQVLTAFVERLFAPGDPAPLAGVVALQDMIAGQLALARANGALLRALETAPVLEKRLAQRRADWIGHMTALLSGGSPEDTSHLERGMAGALDAMLCGALRRLSMPDASHGELERLARSMAAIWAAAVPATTSLHRVN